MEEGRQVRRLQIALWRGLSSDVREIRPRAVQARGDALAGVKSSPIAGSMPRTQARSPESTEHKYLSSSVAAVWVQLPRPQPSGLGPRS